MAPETHAQWLTFSDCILRWALSVEGVEFDRVNLLKPNDPYSGRTAPLTSKSCILYIYSTNIVTEYFKHGKYSPFFFSSKMQFVS